MIFSEDQKALNKWVVNEKQSKLLLSEYVYKPVWKPGY
ncbi:MAG: hypothetical protein IEMM0006_1360 [bacterium]|nr:MAG: hypothetical protein IEMM0006_1360 [bacterium]